MPSVNRNKHLLFQAISVMGKAFSSPVRLELLDLLAQAPRTVESLARFTGQSNANVSQHLQALHAAGMVTRERDGTSVRYEVAGPDALRLWIALRDASILRLAEVERAARDFLGEEVQVIDREELRERLQRGEAILIDVRPAEEYEAGHIEGASSIPIEDLDKHLAELPGDREVVVYCRGPFCVLAYEAVRRLVSAGRTARRLNQGWPEWQLGLQLSGHDTA
jgi:rhodanese-related sulfurtransferase